MEDVATELGGAPESLLLVRLKILLIVVVYLRMSSVGIYALNSKN